MARTKQTARKSEKTGQQSIQRKRDSSSEDDVTPGGFKRVVFPKPVGRSPRKRPASSSPVRSSPRKKSKTNASSGLTSSEDSQDFLSSKEQITDDDEISFNVQGSGTGAANTVGNPGKSSRPPLALKNLKKVAALNSLVRTPRRGKPDSGGMALAKWWNRSGRTKSNNRNQERLVKKVGETSRTQWTTTM